MLSATGLAILCPLFIVVAIAMRISSPGPVFFRHKRFGLGRKVFQMYKFRTMSQNSPGPEFTIANDIRITPIGRMLRKTKLDELPQLINVLLGHMSLVGPRPQSPSLAEHYPEDDLNTILSVRPGITGPTQLWLRHEEELLAAQNNPEQFYIEELLPLKIASDRAYVRKRNLTTDARIVTDTVLAVARLTPAEETSEILDIRHILVGSEEKAA